MDRNTDQNRTETRTETQESDIDHWNANLQEINRLKREEELFFDNWLKSRWLWGEHRRFVNIFKALAIGDLDDERGVIEILWHLDNHQKKLDALQKMIEEIASKTQTDVSKMQKELKEMALPKPARTYIEEFRQDWEAFRKVRERYFGKRGA